MKNNKKIFYYLASLLALLVALVAFLLTNDAVSMGMPAMIGTTVVLAVYVVLMSLIGEGRSEDERAAHHRYLSNRAGLLLGTLVLSVGLVWQLFQHVLDLWLLTSLVVINLAKTTTLIYAYYKH